MAALSPTQRRSSSFNNNINVDKECFYRTTLAIVDTATWYCSIIIIVLILLTTFRDTLPYEYEYEYDSSMSPPEVSLYHVKGGSFTDRYRHGGPCDEIYVVGEGETLHTISDKCNDPYIVERNPHIHDPDDVFPGLVIKIVPSQFLNNRKLL